MTFKPNPNFKKEFTKACGEMVEQTANALAQASREVIETERYWFGWTTSNPIRDIVDTNALNESMQVYEINETRWRIRWATNYVTFVYFGYTLQDGRRIPSRKWVLVALAEAPILEYAQAILNSIL